MNTELIYLKLNQHLRKRKQHLFHQPFLLFQTQFHIGAPILHDVTYVTYSIKRQGMQGSSPEKEAAALGRRGGGKCKQIMNPLAFSAERAIIMLALIENEC